METEKPSIRPEGAERSDFRKIGNWTLNDIANTEKAKEEDRANARAEIKRRQSVGEFDPNDGPHDAKKDLLSNGYGIGPDGEVLYPTKEYLAWKESNGKKPFPTGPLRESIQDRLERKRREAEQVKAEEVSWFNGQKDVEDYLDDEEIVPSKKIEHPERRLSEQQRLARERAEHLRRSQDEIRRKRDEKERARYKSEIVDKRRVALAETDANAPLEQMGEDEWDEVRRRMSGERKVEPKRKAPRTIEEKQDTYDDIVDPEETIRYEEVEDEEPGWDNNWGHTIDDDPIQGYSDDPDVLRKFLEEEDRRRVTKAEKFDDSEPIGFEPVPAIENDELLTKIPEIEKNAPRNELIGQSEALEAIYREAMELRQRFKDPGQARYRLMSVAAVELEKIDLPKEADEKKKVISEEIERAAKVATGDEELDDYSADMMAGINMYLSERLIGGDADTFSIGITEPIVSSNGQIGKNLNVDYKNLVVMRWVTKGINHVFAFSPRKDARIYVLVDDSVGESWRKKFLIAGAIAGKTRSEMIMVNHAHHDEFYHHEKTLERVERKISDKEISLIGDIDLNQVDKNAVIDSIMKRNAELAHFPKAKSEEAKTKGNDELIEESNEA
ncbi:hypothetical protein IKG33_02080 [Candidatus Saccharibacteria bacterium]|nr:hypothetical protein [Candidatus Saccharibacteria bacterium]